MDKANIIIFQSFAEKIAIKAGAILVKERDKFIIKARKSDFLDIATTADFASEEYLIREIKKNYPDHNIISEEKGNLNVNSDFTWILDPLDGTKEYVRGTSMFNVSITLEYKKQIIVGITFKPITNELYKASFGNGTYLNGKKIMVSKEENLRRSMIATHLPHYNNSSKEINITFKAIRKLCHSAYRIRAFYEDVAVLGWVAMGALEGFFITVSGPKWWDVAPGIIMVEESGGKITDIYGEKIINRDLSKGLVATNGKIHDKLIRIIHKK